MGPLSFFRQGLGSAALSFSIFFSWLTAMPVAAAEAALSSEKISAYQKIALDRHLDQDKQWINLLHFKRTMFGFWESQVDDPRYFFSPKGDRDTTDELMKTIEAFAVPIDGRQEKDIAMCRFPARLMWMAKKLPEFVQELKLPVCEKFQKYLKELTGTSVSLVFSSYYLNNPSSAFGHTFLRVNKKPSEDGRRYELLDYGLNYAANLQSSNPLVYSIEGLFGLMPGTFTSVPYYYKVREYNNAESRDLWEYELDMPPGSVDMLVAHTWEIGPVFINYWYLTENCSYHMLTLLEAADPRFDFTDRTKKYIIPADTVKVVWDTPGLIKKVFFRPSIRSEFEERLKSLNPLEKQIVHQIVDAKTVSADLENLEMSRKAAVLDTAVDGIEYKHPVDVQKEDSDNFKFKAKLLSLRSRIDVKTPKLTVLPKEFDEPHLSTGSRRLSFGSLYRKEQESLTLLNYKFALHDYLDPIGGYPEYSKIVFFDMNFSLGQTTGKFFLEEWNLFEVGSMVPRGEFSNSTSWGLKISFLRLQNENCLNCHVVAISGGPGLSFEKSFGTKSLVTAYLGVKSEIDSSYRGPSPRWLFGLGPEARVRIRWSPALISLLEGFTRTDFNTEQRNAQFLKLSTQWSAGKTQGIRAYVYDQWFEKGAGIEWLVYH